MSDLITIVTDDNELSDIKIENDYIVHNGNFIGEGDIFRPIHCTELRKKLHDRGWGNECFKFYSDTYNSTNDLLLGLSSKTYVKTYKYKIGLADNYTISDNYIDDGLPIINQTAEENAPNLIIPKSEITKISNNVNNAFNFLYENQRGERDLKITRTSNNKVDVVNDSVTIVLIDSGTTSTYTNTLDLNDLINHSTVPGISARVDVTYMFSSCDSDIIGGGDATFSAFSIDDENKVSRENVIINKNHVIVEYIDGVIKIYPNTDKISECILNDVVVTYGSLKK